LEQSPLADELDEWDPPKIFSATVTPIKDIKEPKPISNININLEKRRRRKIKKKALFKPIRKEITDNL